MTPNQGLKQTHIAPSLETSPAWGLWVRHGRKRRQTPAALGCVAKFRENTAITAITSLEDRGRHRGAQ